MTNFQLQLTQLESFCRVVFPAMASPCELLLDTTDLEQALHLGRLVQAETRRIEQKFSRYRTDNPLHRINHSNGQAVEVDEETADLLDFAAQLFELSEGRFDITSGLLRRVWTFDGSDRIPSATAVAELLPLIGWEKVKWQRPLLQLPAGMEIDLGGIGKEYAVDKVFDLVTGQFNGACLVNFGGDLRARGPRSDGSAWRVGVEEMRDRDDLQHIELTTGAMATSGDSRRFLLKDGRRFSHILDPLTGWPVQGAPRAVTVYAPTCVQAGVFSTLALMMGDEAEAFLGDQKIPFWIAR